MLGLVLERLKFFDECIWISLTDIGLGLCDSGLLAGIVMTISAAALAVTEFTLCEALTIELEALRAATLTLIR